VPGDEDSRAGRRVTKTLTPGAGFRVKHAIRPQSAVTRVANLPRGEWSCGHSPLRPASAVVREHFAWRLAKSPAEEAAAEEAAAEEAAAEEAGAEEAGTASAAAADGADGADADGADGEGERSCGLSPGRVSRLHTARVGGDGGVRGGRLGHKRPQQAGGANGGGGGGGGKHARRSVRGKYARRTSPRREQTDKLALAAGA
jgi:hypothetical protein